MAAAAMPVLPGELGPFFDGRLEDVVAAARVDPSGGSEAAGTSAQHRGPSVDRVPEVGPTADELLAPAVLGAFVELRDTFRSGDASASERGSGRLLRLVTDAALPFRGTREEVGGPSDNLSWANRGSPESVRSDRSLRLRIELGVITRLHERLAYEVRVAPARYSRISTPHEAALRLLSDTKSALGELRRADAEAMGTLGIVDADGFASKRDAYYERFTQRAAPVLEDRLEAAVLLYASLLGTAWEDAGRPDLGAGEAEIGAVDPAGGADGPPAIYVGSRHSKVLHKSTCPHAVRIKRENLVRFDTAAAVTNAGRTPCRTCKPTLP